MGLSRQIPGDYIPCEVEELKECEKKCGGPTKVEVCNFKVISVLGGTYRGPNGDTFKRYYEKRGPMNCVCKEEPVCGQKCQLVVLFVYGLAKLAAACAMRNPALAR
jgi:hypothetical protein